MSAVENDEHTESPKAIETEGVQLVAEDMTTHFSKDTIPDGITSEHTDLSEDHVASSPSVEAAVDELSTDDTRGETTTIGLTEEVETTEVRVIYHLLMSRQLHTRTGTCYRFRASHGDT